MKMTDQVQDEGQTNYTSLIDIVFLLLVFFMCATQFKQVEQRLDAFLPGDGDDPDREIKLPPEDSLPIFVKDDPIGRQSPIHQIRSMRQATYYPLSRDARPIADLNELQGILARVHDAQPRMRILIVPYDEERDRDQLVPFFNIVAVLDTCKSVGLQNVAFQAPAVMMEQ